MAIVSKDLEFVGVEHNELLDKIYNALKDNKVKEKEAQEFTRNFLVNTILNLKKYTEESNTIGAVYASQNIINPPVIDNLYPNMADKFLSKREKSILNELDEILDLTTQREIDAKIFELERKINEGFFDDKQLVTLYSATNLARYSFKYWEVNSKKWSELGDNPTIMSTGGDIAKSDVGGAVGAWAVNVIPGAGQVAYGSAIISGGVALSVATGVGKLLDWLW